MSDLTCDRLAKLDELPQDQRLLVLQVANAIDDYCRFHDWSAAALDEVVQFAEAVLEAAKDMRADTLRQRTVARNLTR